MIRVRTLGECTIEVDEETVRPEAVMVFGVLLYLGIERGRRVEREVLSSLLWPRSNATRRRHNLRQVLYKLSRLGVRVGSSVGPLSLPTEAVWLDFEDAPVDGDGRLSAGAWPSGGARVLPGYAPRFSAGFRVWLDELRVRVEGAARRRIVAELSRARRESRWDQVEEIARIGLQLDPLNEAATLALAEATALTGSKSKALAMLDAYLEELGPAARDARIPAEVLRRRIGDRLPRRKPGTAEVPMVGRDDVMAELSALVADMRRGVPLCHLVHGPQGIGKTRVIQELARHAALMGVLAVTQRALPDDADTPGLTLTRVFRGLMEQPGWMGISPESLALVRRITAHEQNVGDRPSFDSAEDVLVRALVDLERSIAWESPLLLALDDAHFADPFTVRILRRAHGCLSDERVLFLLSTTTGTDIMGAPATHRVLDRLDAETCVRLARLWLQTRGARVDEEHIEALAIACGGNPFVLREAALAPRQTSQESAQSVEMLLQHRCSELTDGAREMLLSALILGEHANVSLLLATTGLSPHDAERAIVELEQAHVLTCDARGAIGLHGLWLRSLENLFPAAQVAARRIRTAQHLEATSEGRTDAAERLLLSAAQFQRAGDPDRASAVLARGGAALRGRSLDTAAHAAYSRAAHLAPASADVDQRVLQAIHAAAGANQYEDLKYLLEHFGSRLLASPTLAAEVDRLQLISMRLDQMMGNTDPTLIEECERLIQSSQLSAAERLRAAVVGLRVAEFAGDVAAVTRLCDLATQAGSDSEESHSLVTEIRVVQALESRQIMEACQLADNLLNSPRTVGGASRPLECLNARIPHWFNCDFARIDQLLQEARTSLDEYPATLAAVRVADVFASHSVEMMRLDVAREHYELARDLAERFDYRRQLPVIEQTRARLELAEGRSPATPDIGAPRLLGPNRHYPSRDQLFGLCNDVIHACRRDERDAVDDRLGILSAQCDRLAQRSPMDYPFATLAIARKQLRTKSAGASTWDRYLRTSRLALNPPSPFVSALLTEFAIRT